MKKEGHDLMVAIGFNVCSHGPLHFFSVVWVAIGHKDILDAIKVKYDICELS